MLIYACRMTRNLTLAEDLVHDAILATYMAQLAGREIDSFRAYAYGALRLMVLKDRDRRAHRKVVPISEALNLSSTQPTALDLAIRNQKRNAARRVIAELPSHRREVLTRALLGESRQQTQTALGISETQYRLLKNRAQNYRC